jgi:curved DNA-binding protein CbpA
MGNTNSAQSQSMEQFYQNYINQQSILLQQQQQINQLQQQQYQQQQYQQQQYQKQQYQKQQYQQQPYPQQPYPQQSQHNSYHKNPKVDASTNDPQLPSSQPKLDPYTILGIPKQYDARTLKKAYLKAALKTHPDRGGNEVLFQQVSIAYTVLLNKLKSNQGHKNHSQLREESKKYKQSQEIDPRFNARMKDNFDIAVFNKIYEENRLDTPYDDGYGEWLKKDLSHKEMKLFNGKFNKDMFHQEFEKYKQENQPKGRQVVLREPQELVSMKNSDALTTLGQGKIDDFSGSSGDLGYRDLKDAYENPMLYTGQGRSRQHNLQSYERERESMSYTMSEEDKLLEYQKKEREKNEEEERIRRLHALDQRAESTYEAIHSRLLNR